VLGDIFRLPFDFAVFGSKVMPPARRKPGNRTLTDIVAARDAALRLASFDALAGLFLLVRGEGRLAAEFDALFLASARPRAVRSRIRQRSSFAATPRMAKIISAKSEVVSRNGSASDRIPAPARCMSRAIIRRSVVSRERRSTAGVITTSPSASFFISARSCGRSAVVPVIFSRNTFSHPAAFNWRTCPVSSWAAVETR
jgi:hypothetical protein